LRRLLNRRALVVATATVLLTSAVDAQIRPTGTSVQVTTSIHKRGHYIVGDNLSNVFVINESFSFSNVV